MQTVKHYPHGMFCWVDLAADNGDVARNFYTALFGWETEDIPAGEGMTYVMCRHQGEDVCALYTMGAQMRAQQIPTHWITYVSVDDVDAAVERARELGGQVPSPPFDVMDAGRMGMIQDPTGASINLWQPGEHIGARLVNQPQTWCWSELSTRDTRAASDFYAQLFGWTASVSQGLAGPYTSFALDGRLIGGMLEIQPEWGDVPPNWGVYFAVDDCGAASSRITELGGTIMMPETEIPEIGRFAVAGDPQGAVFTIIALDQTDPPPGY